MKNITFESIAGKQEWEKYLLDHPQANFLHSYNWSEFQQALGKKIFRLGIFEEQTPQPDIQIGALLAVKEEAKRGNYLSLAGGPIIDWQNVTDHQLKGIFHQLQILAKQENCLFIRFRPQAIDTPELRQKLNQFHVKESPMHLTADLTLQLDLTQSEDELLKGMRKNTRYEVRKADKENITTKTSQDPADIKEFYEHQLVLADKHGFVPFGFDFLYEQFKVFAADNQALLISSYQGDRLLATAYVLFYNQEAVYHYGISTAANDRLPGSYACQWAAIKEAKQRGLKWYNFWGIAPKEAKNHRFAGVSIFKRGFGGEEVAYLPAHDIPVSPFYWLTYFFELMRSKLRHL
jgi:lipid II:glycine glycyltransferase (peptidoglycan interpeptide bridge formation enzyme)